MQETLVCEHCVAGREWARVAGEHFDESTRHVVEVTWRKRRSGPVAPVCGREESAPEQAQGEVARNEGPDNERPQPEASGDEQPLADESPGDAEAGDDAIAGDPVLAPPERQKPRSGPRYTRREVLHDVSEPR